MHTRPRYRLLCVQAGEREHFMPVVLRPAVTERIRVLSPNQGAQVGLCALVKCQPVTVKACTDGAR
jgi:hypothetical protein